MMSSKKLLCLTKHRKATQLRESPLGYVHPCLLNISKNFVVNIICVASENTFAKHFMDSILTILTNFGTNIPLSNHFLLLIQFKETKS